MKSRDIIESPDRIFLEDVFSMAHELGFKSICGFKSIKEVDEYDSEDFDLQAFEMKSKLVMSSYIAKFGLDKEVVDNGN